jgi:hypothetical protein
LSLIPWPDHSDQRGGSGLKGAHQSEEKKKKKIEQKKIK